MILLILIWSVIGLIVVPWLARRYPHWKGSWRAYLFVVLGGPAIWFLMLLYIIRKKRNKPA